MLINIHMKGLITYPKKLNKNTMGIMPIKVTAENDQIEIDVNPDA